MKTCKDCKRELPLSEFYKHSRMKDGHLNKCKDCVRDRVRDHRERNGERIRAYDRNRPNHEERLRKTQKRQQERKKNSPEFRMKCKATNKVNNGVRDGKIAKGLQCQLCGGTGRKIRAHHPNYNYPTEVIWLCSLCHAKVHQGHPLAKRI